MNSALEPHIRFRPMLLWHLYVPPLRKLIEGWPWKYVTALIGTSIWSMMGDLMGVYGELPVPGSLLVLVATMWGLDLASGIFAVVRDDGLNGITSIGLRRSIVKFVEYSFAIFSAGVLASFSNHLPLIDPILRQAGVLMSFLVALTEFRSIDENLRWGFMGKMMKFIDFRGLASREADRRKRDEEE